MGSYCTVTTAVPEEGTRVACLIYTAVRLLLGQIQPEAALVVQVGHFHFSCVLYSWALAQSSIDGNSFTS